MVVIIMVNIKRGWEGCTLGKKLLGSEGVKGVEEEVTDASEAPSIQII